MITDTKFDELLEEVRAFNTDRMNIEESELYRNDYGLDLNQKAHYFNKEKDSKLYINKTSFVRGSVDALNVAINGTVHGNVYAYGLIQLGADAVIKGDIYYKSIEMEVGAKIDGRLVVCDSDEKIELYKIDIESKGNSTTIRK